MPDQIFFLQLYTQFYSEIDIHVQVYINITVHYVGVIGVVEIMCVVSTGYVSIGTIRGLGVTWIGRVLWVVSPQRD